MIIIPLFLARDSSTKLSELYSVPCTIIRPHTFTFRPPKSLKIDLTNMECASNTVLRVGGSSA